MLKVVGLEKRFITENGTVHAIDRVSFAVPEGQCYALLGPSGCGKTTTLRCVAGLEEPDSGRIEIFGATVYDSNLRIAVPTHQRPIGIVFQSYAIWPHYSVFDNVAYPLRVASPRIPRNQIRERVMAVLELVGMKDLAHRPAPRLSGGQQQRVALARAIVRRPKLLLLDEPLSNLDARLREHMRRELADLMNRIGITALFVTHDQTEALSLAQHIAVMNNGRIVQDGRPREVYAAPSSPFVAEFIGGSNIVDGVVVGRDVSKARVSLQGLQSVSVELDAAPGEAVKLLLRPEGIRISATAIDAANVLTGRITASTYVGHAIDYSVALDGGPTLRVMGSPETTLDSGSPVWLAIAEPRALKLDNVP
jgi:iron(III) transport system ATP-binding protein